MTLAGFAYLWFVLAGGCILAGMVLTGKRLERVSSSKRETRRLVNRMPESRVQREEARCARCGQALEAGARFCGSCGLALPDRRRAHSERERLSRQF